MYEITDEISNALQEILKFYKKLLRKIQRLEVAAVVEDI